MANTTANDWDEGSPLITDPRRQGAAEILSLRQGVGDRIGKEHIDPAAGGVGGEHIQGSAVSYYGTTAPTLKPDGVTALDSADYGRIWVHSITKNIQVYGASGWADAQVNLAAAPVIEHFFKEFTQPWSAAQTQTGLTASKQFLVWVMGTLVNTGESASYTLSVTVNSQSREIVVENHPDGTAPWMMAFVVSSTAGGVISVTAASNYARIISFTGIRLG